MHKLSLKDLLFNNLCSNDKILKNTFPREIGKDYMEKLCIQDGILLLKTDFDFFKPTQIETKQDEKKFVITFSLKGNSRYKSYDKKEKIHFNEGFTTISLFNKTEGVREFNNEKVEQIRLIINEDFLERNFEETILKKYKNNQNLTLIDFSPTRIETKYILSDIYTHSYTNELSSLFLQSKILELLYLEINKISEKKEIISLNTYDKKQIYKAKEILFENIQNPPSIVELAKKVCLNEFKLKKGFRQVFNESPHKLLSKYKLTKAKKMLESGEYNINEVAYLTGYKYANNFTNAFFKEFNIKPKDSMKNRKIY
ncbi:AraC family transcriptional regulator [Arcobacter sp. F2176]|uniref:helix-turn-helix domain-containing protein n=1 Tax=Arcobacter sp. F2176 TaxID=2044511 RepID=UPI00100BB03E|nr:AraC family transcriptional regulator [Arcobacter sp. F2176]RXJ79780.1 transcriptional regulator [Arcobacter sp. F2176]